MSGARSQIWKLIPEKNCQHQNVFVLLGNHQKFSAIVNALIASLRTDVEILQKAGLFYYVMCLKTMTLLSSLHRKALQVAI